MPIDEDLKLFGIGEPNTTPSVSLTVPVVQTVSLPFVQEAAPAKDPALAKTQEEALANMCAEMDAGIQSVEYEVKMLRALHGRIAAKLKGK